MKREVNKPNPFPAQEANGAPPTGKVILLPTLAEPFLRELALALARRGHSLALWIEHEHPAHPLSDEALLELQLAIERAGGISLAEGWPAGGEGDMESNPPPVAWAVEAFGRIDVALAWGETQAPLLARALTVLERRARPRRMVILQPGGEPERIEPVAAEEAALWTPPPHPTRMLRYYLGEAVAGETEMRAAAERAAEFLMKFDV